MRRSTIAISLAGLAVAVSSVVSATPVAPNREAYLAAGRVFPDPHGCLAGAPGTSPWAKGQVCAAQFVQWEEAVDGLELLEDLFGRYVDVVNLRTDAADLTGIDADELRSAGLPQEDLSRLRSDLYVLKVTDRESPVPEAERAHFAYSLSIHGIERAGLEGGLRAAEDLATWAACEDDPDIVTACATEGPFPKRILEPTDSGPTAGDVLDRSVVYFVLANPDGWRRGDVTAGGVYYQRYNGNGTDLNRDWPGLGYVEPLYTPWSEPESRGFGRYLSAIRDRTAAGRFAGSIDLHGMGGAPSFSFTMLGNGQHDYGTNHTMVEAAVATFRDAEARLTWSSLIAPAGECPGPVDYVTVVGNGSVPMCADQWGTVWDTINYATTGSFGDWMDSPVGLGAVSLDNEMALSHLTNDNVFVPEVEQLHIDGNKGLIYSQLATVLDPPTAVFDPGGRIGYLVDPARVHRGGGMSARVAQAALPAQAAVDGAWPTGTTAFDFEVAGPAQGVRNAALAAEVTFSNARGVSSGTFGSVELQYCGPPEHAGDAEGCRTVAGYYNQSFLYLQGGARIDLTDPRPGPYRLVASPLNGPATVHVDFASAPPASVELAPYDVSRLDVFDDLRPFLGPGTELVPVTVSEVLAHPERLADLDTLVVVDTVLPGASVAGYSVRLPGTPQPGFQFDLGPEAAPVPGVVLGGPLDGIHEFEVVAGYDNARLEVEITWDDQSSDFDVALDRFDPATGAWNQVACGCSGDTPGIDRAVLAGPAPGRWRARVENFLATPQAVHGRGTFLPSTPVEGRTAPASVSRYADALAGFARAGGTLVLTDGALQALPLVVPGFVDADVTRGVFYAGWMDFDDGAGATYERHPLAAGVDKEGAAEGTASIDGIDFQHRHQTYEPVPIGYYVSESGQGNETCSSDRCDAPSWVVDPAAWTRGGGTVAARTLVRTAIEPGSPTRVGVSLGEVRLGDGTVRIAGSLLPQPSAANPHPYGLADHALTYTGYQVFENLVRPLHPPARPAAAGEVPPGTPAAGAGAGVGAGRAPERDPSVLGSQVSAPSTGGDPGAATPGGALAATGGVGAGLLALVSAALVGLARRRLRPGR